MGLMVAGKGICATLPDIRLETSDSKGLFFLTRKNVCRLLLLREDQCMLVVPKACRSAQTGKN